MSSLATITQDDRPLAGASVSGALNEMSVRQREFARAYVLNGGRIAEAACEAGYGEADPGKAGRRCLLNAKVLHEIKRLSILHVEAHLPIAIKVLVDIASDPEQDAASRVKAATALLDRGGMAAPKGGVQVNVGVQVDSQGAQTLIGEIWDAKSRRVSGILPAMPDIEGQHAARLIAPPAALAAGPGGGGVQVQGPVAAAASLPPPSDANLTASMEPSRFNGEPTWPDDLDDGDDDGERGVLDADEGHQAGGGGAAGDDAGTATSGTAAPAWVRDAGRRIAPAVDDG